MWTLASFAGACGLGEDGDGPSAHVHGLAIVHEGLVVWWADDGESSPWWSHSGSRRNVRGQVARADGTLFVRERIPVLKMLPDDPFRSGVAIRIAAPGPRPGVTFALLQRFTPEASRRPGASVGVLREYTPLTCADGAVVIDRFSSFFLDMDRRRAPGVVATSRDGQVRTFALAQCGIPDRAVARPWGDPEVDLAIVALPGSADGTDEMHGTFDCTLTVLRAGKSWTRDHELVDVAQARRLSAGGGGAT